MMTGPLLDLVGWLQRAVWPEHNAAAPARPG
jgi:hypothetical protein